MSRQYDITELQRVFAYLPNALKALPEYTNKAQRTIYLSKTVYGREDNVEYVFKTECDSRADCILAVHPYIQKRDPETGHLLNKNISKPYLKPEIYEQCQFVLKSAGIADPNRRY